LKSRKFSGRLILRGACATVLATATAALLGATPAAASTKYTCNTGYAGECTTESLKPYYNGPNDGVFYIGAGAASNNVILEVVEQGTDVVHTKYIVPKNTTWHDYRGGFNPNKYYYLRVGSKGWNTGSNMVVGSIEDRPL
jgi:hypothetical protein